MTSVSKIIVRYNQQKRALLFFILGFMLVAGVGIIVKSLSKKPFLNPYILPFGIFILIGFFAIIIFARRFFVNNNVLVIDDDGITNNISNASFGFIPWKDVIEVKKKKVAGGRFICVFVNNPNDYLNNGATLIQKKRMDFNKTYCETPVVISAKGLALDYYTLLEIIQRKHNLYKEQENYLKDKGISADL